MIPLLCPSTPPAPTAAMAERFRWWVLADDELLDAVVLAGPITEGMEAHQAATVYVRHDSSGFDSLFEDDGTPRTGPRSRRIQIWGDPMGVRTLMVEGFVDSADEKIATGWWELQIVGTTGHKGAVGDDVPSFLPALDDDDQWLDTNVLIDRGAPSADDHDGLWFKLGYSFSAAKYTTPPLTAPITGTINTYIDGGGPYTAILIDSDIAGAVAAIQAAVGSHAYVVSTDGSTIDIASHRYDFFSFVRVDASSDAQTSGFEANGTAHGDPENWLAGREVTVVMPFHTVPVEWAITAVAWVPLFCRFPPARGLQVTTYRDGRPVVADTATIPKFTTQYVGLDGDFPRGQLVPIQASGAIPARTHFDLRVLLWPPAQGGDARIGYSAIYGYLDVHVGADPGRSTAHFLAVMWQQQFRSTNVDWAVNQVGVSGTIYLEGLYVSLRSWSDPLSQTPADTEWAPDPANRQVLVGGLGQIGRVRDDVVGGDRGDFIVQSRTSATSGRASRVIGLSSDSSAGTPQAIAADDTAEFVWTETVTAQPGSLVRDQQDAADTALELASRHNPRFEGVWTTPVGGRCPADRWSDISPGDGVPVRWSYGADQFQTTPRVWVKELDPQTLEFKSTLASAA